jgi:PilZ domain
LSRKTKMAERRGSVRQKSFLRGCVYFDKRSRAVDCLIRDISDQGARIIFSDAVNVPELIELFIPQKEQTLRARVQWRHGHEIGLAFAGRASGTPPAELELVQRVERLEAEILSLKRLVKRIKDEVESGERSDDAA